MKDGVINFFVVPLELQPDSQVLRAVDPVPPAIAREYRESFQEALNNQDNLCDEELPNDRSSIKPQEILAASQANIPENRAEHNTSSKYPAETEDSTI